LAVLPASIPPAHAGPLDPPPGPVAPTPGPEPRIPINATNTPGDANSIFRITQPGSYYLTGNVAGASGFNGIEITSSNVTIDLMGYTLQGAAGSLTGIVANLVVNNFTLRNGIITGWGSGGVTLVVTTTEHNRLIENIHTSANGSAGIEAGRRTIVRACTARANTGAGIVGLDSCQFESCIAEANVGNGITLGAGAVARACTAHDNSAVGILGSGSNARIVDCVSTSNGGDGISMLSALVTGCVSGSNDGDGIQASQDAIIESNVCTGNGNGSASGAGIHVIGARCRVQSNIVSVNDRGIEVDMAGNLVVGNTAAGNATEYDISAGNGVGPIVTAANVATNTNPNANFDL
jgi:parallel beta-helix repeat protein